MSIKINYNLSLRFLLKLPVAHPFASSEYTRTPSVAHEALRTIFSKNQDCDEIYILRIKAGARGCNPRVKSHPATCAVDAEQSKVSSIRGTFDCFL